MKRRLIPYWMAGVAWLMLAPALAPGQTARMLQDISPTTSSGASPLDAPPRPLGVAGGRMLFAASDGVHGRELFVTDGTTSGTRLLLDIRPGTTSSLVGISNYYSNGRLYQMTKTEPVLSGGGRVFFNADDGVHGKELWRSDGTEAGTALFHDGWPGAGNGYARDLFAWNGMVFIRDSGGLFASNGTSSGALRQGDFRGALAPLCAHRGRLYLAGDVWRGSKYVSWNDRIFSTDGTTSSMTVCADDGQSRIQLFGVVNGKLISTFTKPIFPNPYPEFDWYDTRLCSLDLAGNQQTELARSLVGSWYGNRYTNGSTIVNGVLYLTGVSETLGSELWRTEGTTATTRVVADIDPGSVGSVPEQMTPLGGRLIFSATTQAAGRELWATEGTSQTTRMLGDLYPGVGGSVPFILGVCGDHLFFTADDGVHGRELWRTDGTPEGTLLLRDINAGGGSSPTLALSAGGALYFTADDGVHGRELWRSDGWPAGTRMVQDIRPGPASSEPCNFMAWGDDVFFSADDGVHGPEPWMLSARRNAVGRGWGLYR